jgi:ArsR family transcriptional regulator
VKNNEYLRVFRAFSDANRLRVLEILLEGEQCACILLEDLDINQSTLSHHMKILCDSGIVTGRRVGKWIYYSINDTGLDHARELLARLMVGGAELPARLISLSGRLRPYARAIRVFLIALTKSPGYAPEVSGKFLLLSQNTAGNARNAGNYEGKCCR